MPAGNFCRINEAPSFGFPHTANISSPGWFLGSTGFHGMASLVVKVPWVAPAFAGRRQTRPTASAAATMIFERDLLRGASDISITLASLIAFSFGRGNRKDFGQRRAAAARGCQDPRRIDGNLDTRPQSVNT